MTSFPALRSRATPSRVPATRHRQPRATAIIAVLGIGAFLRVQEASVEAQRLPEPDAVEREIARETILKLYQSDYARKDPESRRELASKLLLQAEIDSDPATRYTLLEEARTVATLAVDVELALAAVSRLARSYEIDGTARKRSTLESIRGSRVRGLEALILAEAWLELADESLGAGSYGLAVEDAGRATRAAARSKLRWLVAAARAREKDIETIHREYRKLEDTMLALRSRPGTPEENSAAGTFLCVFARDWKRGLALLAKGSDETLKALAEQDLAAPTKPSERQLLGDIWWKLASRAKKQTRTSYLERTAHWYRAALPGLSGLESVAVEKRLREISAQVPERSTVPLGDLKVLCWKGGLWREYPANVMTISSQGEALSAKNTTEIHTRAKLACLRELDDGFSACLEIRGGHTIGLTAASGQDRQLSIPGTGEWRKIRIRRVQGELRFSVDGELVPYKIHKSTPDMPGFLCVTLLEDDQCEIRRLDLLGG